MLNSLRDSTKKLHEELEKETLAGQIISHEISLDDYQHAHRFVDVNVEFGIRVNHV